MQSWDQANGRLTMSQTRFGNLTDPSALKRSVVLNFLRDAAGNQSVPESTQGFQTQGERRMTQWTLISFTRKARRPRGMETTRARKSPKAKGNGKHSEKGKSSGKGKSSQETFRGTCRNCCKTGQTWSECWAKGGGAAQQANSVGETEKIVT